MSIGTSNTSSQHLSQNTCQSHATQGQWRTGGFGGFKPPPEILKTLQNGAKLNLIVKTVKNC